VNGNEKGSKDAAVGRYFFFFTVQKPDGTSDDPFHMMDTVEVEVK
jgi:hypothetical protein